jgi:hypothetical protein
MRSQTLNLSLSSYARLFQPELVREEARYLATEVMAIPLS